MKTTRYLVKWYHKSSHEWLRESGERYYYTKEEAAAAALDFQKFMYEHSDVNSAMPKVAVFEETTVQTVSKLWEV